ncbi:hypothetical protein ACLB6G_16915 [Zhengella sp. ZM62]|uniref:hypothetical protein n=1 Tax=Zhengella sedimenti TaxID=3390035 RepID=UPI003976C982
MPAAVQTTIDDVAAMLAPHGLMPRGGFVFATRDAAPAGPDGLPARSVLLAGHGGGSIWEPFNAWRQRQETDPADPLDAWSKAVIGDVAERFGARAVFPSDPPYLPFQQWAMRAEGLRPSPLGLLMHPVFGLWHAYRGALLFGEALDMPLPEPARHPCDACDAKPCLAACPVQAYGPAGFDAAACGAHARSPSGIACRDQGCLARNACPAGLAWRYPAAQQRFHQAAFLRA